MAEKLADIRARAARRGRSPRFGIRLHVIVRETDEEAWRAADSLISHLDDAIIAKAQAAFAKMDSVGQRRGEQSITGPFGEMMASDILPKKAA